MIFPRPSAFSALLAGLSLLLTAGLRAADPVPARLGNEVLLDPKADVRATAPAPQTTIDSDRLDMKSTDNESDFVFSDHVTVHGNDLKLSCDRLEVTTLRGGDLTATVSKLGSFKRLIALGHVVIVQGDREATCGRAELMPGEDKIILTETPVVIDHSNNGSVTGTRITLYRGERRAIVENDGSGQTHVTLPAIKDLGFENTKPAPTPTPAK